MHIEQSKSAEDDSKDQVSKHLQIKEILTPNKDSPSSSDKTARKSEADYPEIEVHTAHE